LPASFKKVFILLTGILLLASPQYSHAATAELSAVISFENPASLRMTPEGVTIEKAIDQNVSVLLGNEEAPALINAAETKVRFAADTAGPDMTVIFQ
jgi:hypothetical protein